MKKRAGWLLLLGWIILLGVGCIPQGSQPSLEPARESTMPTLRIIADSEQALAAFRQKDQEIADKFGVKMEYHFPDRLTDNLENYLFNTKDTFDIYVLFPAKLESYIQRKMIVPLDGYMDENSPWFQDIKPIYRNCYMKSGGRWYGVVYDGDSHLLFYRKDLFEKYGPEYEALYGRPLQPPTTWEEYDKIARFLTRDTNGDGKIDLWGGATFGADAKRYVWFSERFLSYGGRYFDDEMHPQIQGPLGVKALKDWIDFNETACPPGAMYDWIDLNNAFLQGKVATVVQWSDTARFSYDTQIWKSQVVGKVGWTLVPRGQEGAPQGGVWIGRVLAVSSQSANPDLAFRVIEYITGSEASSEAVVSAETINDPYRISHFQHPERSTLFPDLETAQNFYRVLEDSLKNPMADLNMQGGWEYMQALDKYLGLALIKKLSPEEALQKAAEEWEKITEQYGREVQKENYSRWRQQEGGVGP